jgi:hypothetical protein
MTPQPERTEEPMDNSTAESIATAPLPTSRTLRLRRNVPFQLLRFVAINLRMARVILRGHR